MSEESKAVEEVAKTTGKLVELTDKLGSFVGKVIGGASNQVGGILEDWVKYQRYKILLAIGDKVEAIHTRRKIEDKTISIPLRTAMPMLEAASLEEDATLQDIWARLIANSMDPGFTQPLHPSYTEIIKQMCPDEAIILNAFREIKGYPLLVEHQTSQESDRFRRSADTTYDGIYTGYVGMCKKLPLKHQDGAHAYLDNLRRLQLVEFGCDFSQSMEDSPFGSSYMGSPFGGESVSEKLRLTLNRNEYLRMTAFGEGFVAACIRQ